MANRVLIGNDGNGVYKLRVSKPTKNVLTDGAGDMLFDSARYRTGLLHKTQANTSGFNNFLGSDTALADGTEYMPLCLFYEKHHRIRVSKTHTSNPYYLSTTATYRLRISDGSNVVVDSNDYVQDSVDEHFSVFEFTNRYDLTSNSVISSGTLTRGITLGWNGGAGEHGAKANRLSTFTPTSNNTISFRNANGSVNAVTYGVTTGSNYQISGTDSGGAAVVNARAAVLKIPMGYGYMTSSFFGF